MNIRVKYVLIFLIFYVVIKIMISKEYFQIQTAPTNPTTTPELLNYDSQNIMDINNNSVTYLENDLFNLGNKISVTKDNTDIENNVDTGNTEIENNVDRINAKRLCIIEGNDIECINASELGNALDLPDYRRNSVCIDGSCMTKNSLDILKSMTPSGRSNSSISDVFDKNMLKLKSADDTSKCFSKGQMRAHTCASHNSRLTVTRADGGTPNSGRGWGQDLKVGGNTQKKDGSTYLTGVACGSRFAADAYVWDGTNNSSSCIPFDKYIGKRRQQAIVDLPLGKYYVFRPGLHRGTDQLDQYCCWSDVFKCSLSPGEKIGGEDLYYETLKQDDCSDEKSKLKFEASKDANHVLMVNGSLDGPSGQTEINTPRPINHH